MTSLADLGRAATTSEQHRRHAAEFELGAEGHVDERILALGERALVGLDQMILPVRIDLRFTAPREANLDLSPVDVR